MKKLYYTLFVLLVFVSCKKNDLSGDNGCISQAERQKFNIKSTDSIAAVQLMKQNNIPYNDLQLEYIHFDTLKINGTTNIIQNVFGIQYINGLPMLSYDFGYTFKNGVFQEVTGKRYSAVNLDTHPTQSLPHLRALYVNDVNNEKGTYISESTHEATNIAASVKDSCLVAEFGYYDLNANIDNSTPNFVKAWSITPKNSPYPQIIFRDDNGKKILYNIGPVLD